MEAVIENGQVTNIIVGHIENSIPIEDILPTILPTQMIDGFNYDIQVDKVVKVYTVVDKPIYIPKEVQMWQAREALIISGVMPAQIDAIIATLPSPQKELAQNQWEYSPTVKRYNSWVSDLAPLVSFTELQLDEMFIAASKL